MKVWSFYDPETGLFAPQIYRGNSVQQNTPAGLVAIEGNFDRLRERFDTDSERVVSYQPPAPSEDHAWDESTRQYELKPEALEANIADAQARDELREQDIAAMRSVMEILLNPNDSAARARLQQAYDAQMQTRRNLKS